MAEPPRSTMTPAPPLRIDEVTVIDPRDGSIRPGTSVLMREGRIAQVIPTAETSAVAGVRVIDGRGRYIVPGYINMHTHVLQEKRSSLFLATMLAEGTTGMRQMAGSKTMLRRRAENRLGLGDGAPGLLALPGALLMPFNAPDARRARKEISRQRELGADFIKLIQVEREVFFEAVDWAHRNGLRVAGHLPPSVSPREASEAGFDSLEHLGTSSNLWIETSAERVVLRREEDTSGPFPNWLGYVPFAQKIFSSELAAKAIAKTLINPALSNSAELVTILQRALDSFDEDAADRLVEVFATNRTWQTPTLVRLRTEYRVDDPAYADHPWMRMMSPRARADFLEARERFMALPASTRETYHQYYEMTLMMVKRMHDAGVPLLSGTDGPGGNPGQDLQSEFRELAAAGIAPLDILRAATTLPAEFLGRADRMGAVAEGMDADLVLLDADPLQHVDNLAAIAAVVRGGHHLPRETLTAEIDRLLAAAPS
ncbi:amidohydrolase family protein [Microbacterium sp. SORGH_AS_0888]|uniref:amidohydrolase family protein n=1 Tax=Microbacterium sp. SORGH_AS_0888 TaxID=3041791 RepID=UPI00278A8B44|nr:amidohydrolase family protein [Microbacterium sp. SORGH_AS_0888]MDQ1128952.1 imidazolonepropionase-like amidohydrolase [Microbacterium sp. SORGH_AS_0888]